MVVVDHHNWWLDLGCMAGNLLVGCMVDNSAVAVAAAVDSTVADLQDNIAVVDVVAAGHRHLLVVRMHLVVADNN